jgi:protease I
MVGELDGRTIAFLMAAPEGVDQVELTAPWRAVADAGGSPRPVSTSPGRVRARNHLDRADDFEVNATVDAVGIDQFDSCPSLKTDIRNADGLWVDEEVMVCTKGPNVLVSSRSPEDLKAFCPTTVQVFSGPSDHG